MTTKDYRIGNIVMDKVSGEWMTIEELTKENVICKVINREKYPLPDGWQMTGIPLSPEVLIRCRWGEFCLYRVFYNEKLFKEHGNSVFWFQNVDLDLQPDGHFAKQVVFLHDLQNLYWILMGEEIKIKI